MNSETGFPSSLVELGSRIKLATARAGSQRAVAAKIGVAHSTFGRWIAGEAEPGLFSMVALAKAAGVQLVWLITGEGPMVADLAGQAPSADLGPHKIQMDEELLAKCLETANRMFLEGNELRAARGEPPIEITWAGLGSVGGNLYEQSFNAWVDDERRRRLEGTKVDRSPQVVVGSKK